MISLSPIFKTFTLILSSVQLSQIVAVITRPSDLDCDFEGRSVCAWRNGTNGLEDNFDWLLATSVITDGYHSIPRAKDGSYDVFTYVKGSNQLKHQDTALLISDTIPCQEGAGVLSFYLWKTAHFPSVEICIRKPPGESSDLSCIHKVYGMHRQEWVYREYQIPADHEPFEIVFRAAFQSHVDIIGLDEIKYNARLCRSRDTQSESLGYAVPDYAINHYNNYHKPSPQAPLNHPTVYKAQQTGHSRDYRVHQPSATPPPYQAPRPSYGAYSGSYPYLRDGYAANQEVPSYYNPAPNNVRQNFYFADSFARNQRRRRRRREVQDDNSWLTTSKLTSDRVIVKMMGNDTVYLKSLVSNQTIKIPVDPRYRNGAIIVAQPNNVTLEIANGLVRVAPDGTNLITSSDRESATEPSTVATAQAESLQYLAQYIPLAMEALFGSIIAESGPAGEFVSGLLSGPNFRRRQSIPFRPSPPVSNTGFSIPPDHPLRVASLRHLTTNNVFPPLGLPPANPAPPSSSSSDFNSARELRRQFGLPPTFEQFIETGTSVIGQEQNNGTGITQRPGGNGGTTTATTNSGSGGSDGNNGQNPQGQCPAVNCNFDNNAGLCNYQQSSRRTEGSVAPWKLSSSKVANSLTGIQKDASGSGQYAYAGGSSTTTIDIYIMESGTFSTSRDTRLEYSLYQAGVIGRLKVCINDEFNCIAEHLGKDINVNSRRWIAETAAIRAGQNMKVLFIAEGLKKNYVIGVDSIRLLTSDGRNEAAC